MRDQGEGEGGERVKDRHRRTMPRRRRRVVVGMGMGTGVDERACWSPRSLLQAESESDDGGEDEERVGATTQRA